MKQMKYYIKKILGEKELFNLIIEVNMIRFDSLFIRVF